MNEDKNFEVKMQELETIVKNIESGNLSLEESLKQFYQGICLSKSLLNKLDEIDKKIEMILDDGTDLKTIDFEE